MLFNGSHRIGEWSSSPRQGPLLMHSKANPAAQHKRSRYHHLCPATPTTGADELHRWHIHLLLSRAPLKCKQKWIGVPVTPKWYGRKGIDPDRQYADCNNSAPSPGRLPDRYVGYLCERDKEQRQNRYDVPRSSCGKSRRKRGHDAKATAAIGAVMKIPY